MQKNLLVMRESFIVSVSYVLQFVVDLLKGILIVQLDTLVLYSIVGQI